MNVVRFSKYKSQKTIRLLRALLTKAEAGDLIGVAVCYRSINGSEDAVTSGFYDENSDAGVAAALRLSVTIAAARGEYKHSP